MGETKKKDYDSLKKYLHSVADISTLCHTSSLPSINPSSSSLPWQSSALDVICAHFTWSWLYISCFPPQGFSGTMNGTLIGISSVIRLGHQPATGVNKTWDHPSSVTMKSLSVYCHLSLFHRPKSAIHSARLPESSQQNWGAGDHISKQPNSTSFDWLFSLLFILFQVSRFSLFHFLRITS